MFQISCSALPTVGVVGGAPYYPLPLFDKPFLLDYCMLRSSDYSPTHINVPD